MWRRSSRFFSDGYLRFPVRFAQRTAAPHPHRRVRGKELVAAWRRTRLGLARSGWGGGREKGESLGPETEAEAAVAVANASAMASDGGRVGERESACDPSDR